MSTIQATNPVTGKSFAIKESEFASTYQPLGWTIAGGGQTNTPTPSPTQPASSSPNPGTSTVYHGNDQMNIPSFDQSYWEGQGWSSTAPASSAPSQTQPTPTQGQPEQSPIQPTQPEDPTGISQLVASGRAFNEIDAKNYAYSQGEANWQQYIGGIGGQTNPLYIGSTNWSQLQKTYTPYQLEQATTRTKDGIYWNPDVNISDIPRVDPSIQINNDIQTIANLVADAKADADPFSKDDKPEIKETAEENQQTLMDMLVGEYGNEGAEAMYNELFNSPEMKAAQEDVIKYKTKNDEYDDMLEELKNDIRKEVAGEAPDSYINALASVRGDKILKLKRANQRDLDAATANLNNLKENANNLLNVRTKDADNRYNRLFQMLQLQIQQEGTAFNQAMALATMALQMPEGRSMTIAGNTIIGLKESDNLNVVQFTESNGKTYVIGIDKKTGQQVYKEYIGTSKVAGGSAPTAVQVLNEYKATQELEYLQQINAGLSAGTIDIDYDDKGNAFYYDAASYNNDVDNKSWWKKKPDTIDYRL